MEKASAESQALVHAGAELLGRTPTPLPYHLQMTTPLSLDLSGDLVMVWRNCTCPHLRTPGVGEGRGGLPTENRRRSVQGCPHT